MLTVPLAYTRGDHAVSLEWSELSSRDRPNERVDLASKVRKIGLASEIGFGGNEAGFGGNEAGFGGNEAGATNPPDAPESPSFIAHHQGPIGFGSAFDHVLDTSITHAKRFGKRETMLLVPAFNEWSEQVRFSHD